MPIQSQHTLVHTVDVNIASDLQSMSTHVSSLSRCHHPKMFSQWKHTKKLVDILVHSEDVNIASNVQRKHPMQTCVSSLSECQHCLKLFTLTSNVNIHLFICECRRCLTFSVTVNIHRFTMWMWELPQMCSQCQHTFVHSVDVDIVLIVLTMSTYADIRPAKSQGLTLMIFKG